MNIGSGVLNASATVFNLSADNSVEVDAGVNAGLGALIAFTLGWFLAQSAKLVVEIIKAANKNEAITLRDLLERFVASGGMPSSHTASFVALSAYFGLQCGFTSNIFALAACTSVIVIYDALNVRHAVGEQGKVLNSLSKKKLRIVEGHTIPQAIIGGLIGVVVGVFVAFVL